MVPRLAEGMAEFIDHLKSEAARYPARETLSIDEARHVAELVRARWREGGPTMETTDDIELSTRHGLVTARIYRPKKILLVGSFVYLHGGGWVLFSNDTHDRLMREYADRAGITVVGVDYTRAPEARFPQQIEEVADVVRSLSRISSTTNSRLDPLVIGGDSAGGNLAVVAAMLLRDDGENVLRGMILNYGCFDADLLYGSCISCGSDRYTLTPLMMIWFYLQYLPLGTDIRDPRVSPLKGNLGRLPPTLMVMSDLDMLRDQNVAMSEALRAAGNSVEAKIYEGTVHSFIEAMSIAPVSLQAVDDTVHWLGRHLPSYTA